MVLPVHVSSPSLSLQVLQLSLIHESSSDLPFYSVLRVSDNNLVGKGHFVQDGSNMAFLPLTWYRATTFRVSETSHDHL